MSEPSQNLSGLTPYIGLDPDSLFRELKTSLRGLSHAQLLDNLKRFGHNSLVTIKPPHPLKKYLKGYTDPLAIILLLVAAISLILGDRINAVIVLAMVFLSTTLDFIQEHQASQAAKKLQEKVAIKATVVRDGQELDVKATDLVPGDIIILNAGDLVPADARLIETKDCYANESSLTGESVPVEKTAQALTLKSPDLASLANMVFYGSSILTGTATAVIVQTGARTVFGGIAQALDAPEESNDFTRGVKAFSRLIFKIIVIFVVIIFIINALFHHQFLESLAFAIAVAVGLTPEFLPMIMSVTMAKGAYAMSGKGVIVKKLTAIPTFGSMNILCTDKTGTLTKDHIELVKYINAAGKDDESVFERAYVNAKLQTGITNPLDNAVIEHKTVSLHHARKLDEIPFDFNRKRLSVIYTQNKRVTMVTKGAPEAVFAVCSQVQEGNKSVPMNPAKRHWLEHLYDILSDQGYRVLAVATKSYATPKTTFEQNEESDMTFYGFTAFLDPVKPKVKDSFNALEAIGIEVKVITGDNERVTLKICAEADIPVQGVLLGHDIDKLSDTELARKAAKTTIFARFSPDQKQRVIKCLRLAGHVVGYMGDGINDAPSLKAADVGISVENATDVAKETASIILTHKSLSVLRDGVTEGRKTFGNTMKYVMMGLSSNFGNMFSVLFAVLFIPFLPMLPIQILLNNFMYDLSQITIPLDNVDETYLTAPKHWDLFAIKRFMILLGPISSAFDLITFGFLWTLYSHVPAAFQTGWFVESLATQTLVIHIIRTRHLPFVQSLASPFLLISTFTIVVLGWLLSVSPLGELFSLYALPPHVLAILAVIVAIYLIVTELGKELYYRKLSPRTA